MDAILQLLESHPEAVVDFVHTYVQKYKPVIYGSLKEILSFYQDYAENTELQEITAKIQKNYYDAYVRVGFLPNQAMNLLLSTNLKPMGSMKKLANSLPVE